MMPSLYNKLISQLISSWFVTLCRYGFLKKKYINFWQNYGCFTLQGLANTVHPVYNYGLCSQTGFGVINIYIYSAKQLIGVFFTFKESVYSEFISVSLVLCSVAVVKRLHVQLHSADYTLWPFGIIEITL